jgi:hypothetical protein
MRQNFFEPAAKKDQLTRHKLDVPKKADLWTWIVLGLVFGAVTAALGVKFVYTGL